MALFKDLFIFTYVTILVTFMNVGYMDAWYHQNTWKLLGLEIRMIISHHISAGKQSQVLCENGKGSYPLSRLSSFHMALSLDKTTNKQNPPKLTKLGSGSPYTKYQHSVGRGRTISASVSSRPAWSTELVPGQAGPRTTQSNHDMKSVCVCVFSKWLGLAV